ncbi:LysR family transcriptional regulator [Mangrovibacter plantisponsor]|uniref:LysR family transcriptional regulator n=1 Tax=Mangrovibacter plantisponsor TaxID=451513 RepID=A0A317Q0D5_9ENTR|nr:LysR family transcriptional regulator [Mangrovibacter plantisponsor]PWW08270.1 LysR family transcriptional regulator [Mangrovibacter plantisponsor]
MVNPQWLRSFAALAQQGNFTRAADSLLLTQSAVSQHVKQLEAEYGQLIIRHSRHVELTPAGQVLLRFYDEVSCAEKRLNASLAARNDDQGEISVISPGSIGLSLYPLLLDLQLQCPALTVRYRFAPDKEVVDAVLNNHFELGIVPLKPDTPSLNAEFFANEHLELIVPAGVSVQTWQDLEKLGFINHPDGAVMATRLLSRWFPGNPGVASLPEKGFINQIGLILEPVARGMGFTVLPRFARTAFSRQDAIKTLEIGPEVVNSLWLIFRAEWPLSRRAQRALSVLRTACETKRATSA